jgi:maleylacetoacetate isomerase
MSELILYSYFRSSTSYRARIALNYKNLPYKYIPVHLTNNGGEQFLEEYKILNPLSEVPTLVHQGKSLSQSVAIIEYLDEVFPNPILYPRDPYRKARVRQFCEIINSFIHPLSNLKVLKKLETDNGYDQKKKEQWVKHWSQLGFSSLENLVDSNSKYCFGEEITAADVFLAPAIFSANRFQVNLVGYKKLLDIEQRLNEHPAFMDAHPLRQPDTPEFEKTLV